MRVGVYIGQVRRQDGVSLQAVADYARNLSPVEKVTLMGFQPALDPVAIAAEIRSERLERIVLAGDSPGYFKPAFARAMAMAGARPAEVFLASFREHGAASLDANDRAKAVVACAVHGVPFKLVAVPEPAPVKPATLVIGAGIAGLQAALEIAEAGKRVHLVERSATIGGHMAMFDKTFPTLDCAACILTPRMVAVGDHEMISRHTTSEVVEVTGGPGAYRVKISHRARRVDEAACVVCNACTEVCPISTWSEFDCGLTHRKAVYMPFPQAVPNAYVVDPASCLYVQSGGKRCGVCAKKCPKGCIDLDEEDRVFELEVGNIIVATGYDLLDPRRIQRYGYGVFPDVLTSLEFERMCNSAGPTGGRIVLKSKRLNKRTKGEEWVADPQGPAPGSVAIIHCVGSRDAAHNAYCSRVCCMYSLKFAHLIHEKLPDATCYEFYIDMRAFGKGYEEFMERIKAEGTHVVRGRSAQVAQSGGRMVVKGEDILQDRVVELPVDMVILAVGVLPTAGAADLAALLGIPRDPDGFFSELNYNGEPTFTERGGIYVAGMCQGPKDIPDTVAQASAVAASVLRSISAGQAAGDLSSLKLSDIEQRAVRLAAAATVG